MQKDPTYLKHQIEVWASIIAHLHRCIGLSLEGEKHPDCRIVLEALIVDIREVMQSL